MENVENIEPIYYFELLDKIIQNHKKLKKFLSKHLFKWRFFVFLFNLFIFLTLFCISMLLASFILFTSTTYFKLTVSLAAAIILFFARLFCFKMIHTTTKINMDTNLIKENSFANFIINLSNKLRDTITFSKESYETLRLVEKNVGFMFSIIYLGLNKFEDKFKEIDEIIEKNSPTAFVELYYKSKMQLKRMANFMYLKEDLNNMTLTDCIKFLILTKYLEKNKVKYQELIDELGAKQDDITMPSEEFHNKFEELINTNLSEYANVFKEYVSKYFK